MKLIACLSVNGGNLVQQGPGSDGAVVEPAVAVGGRAAQDPSQDAQHCRAVRKDLERRYVVLEISFFCFFLPP